jgi:hypothetical protein
LLRSYRLLRLLCSYRLLRLVIIQKMKETKIGYRGSNSPVLGEKEQRVDGCLRKGFLTLHYLRCTLMGFEKNYQAINLSKQINIHRTYTSKVVPQAENYNFKINSLFITGFTDGEGCFTISIYRKNKSKLG